MEIIDTTELFRDERTKLKEDNDCTVRALAVAFDLTYSQAHQFCTLYMQRRKGKGFPMATNFNGKDHLSSKVTSYVFNKRYLYWCVREDKVDCTGNKDVGKVGIYLKKFLERCDKNATYIILSSGHAYCVKKGVIYGNPNDHRTYVKLAYKLK
jgi:hypothetical protein